jgi:hypothetical protein
MGRRSCPHPRPFSRAESTQLGEGSKRSIRLIYPTFRGTIEEQFWRGGGGGIVPRNNHLSCPACFNIQKDDTPVTGMLKIAHHCH